jgi:hypothetical protein
MFYPTAEFRNEERAKYIEKQKQRQELQRQQEERIAAARKAAEKAPHETAMDKLKETKKLVNSIQIGSPYERRIHNRCTKAHMRHSGLLLD